MNRSDFITRLLRYILLAFLAAVAAIAGSRSTLKSDCSSCPGSGICSGETDCSIYTGKNNGGTEKQV